MHDVTLFKKEKPTVADVYNLYTKGMLYNRQINLDETVKVNENFYIGK